MQYFNEKFEDCVTIGASFSSSSVTMALPNTQYNPNYVAPEETAEIAVVAAEKAKKGPDIKWTDDNLRRFLEQVDKNKAYLAEPGATVAKGNTIGQKFDVIAIYLSTLPAFAALNRRKGRKCASIPESTPPLPLAPFSIHRRAPASGPIERSPAASISRCVAVNRAPKHGSPSRWAACMSATSGHAPSSIHCKRHAAEGDHCEERRHPVELALHQGGTTC